jgi:assimilatory nitrate reductase catalytic subunit
MNETKSSCCYCGVGCGVIIQSEGERIIGVRGDPDHPANFGRLCTKGATLHLTARNDLRALYPELRSARAKARQRVSWDEALDHAAGRFAQIIRDHGPDSVAFYISGQLLTEDYYVFNKLAKGLIGTNNVDTNSRLCMSSAVAGYKATLGMDAPPNCYEDIDHAQCLFIAGSNTAFAHPIVYRRIEDARAKNPALKIIVVDPRRTDTAAAADLHLAIAPGTDIALCNAMLNVLLAEGMVDRGYIAAHTEGFDAIERTARATSVEQAAAICGIRPDDIVTAARWFGASRATLSLYCQGLNQSSHGTHNNAALINLHLATAQIGRPGAGPFSLTGQPNAMGGREVGGLANLLSAHRELANPAHRAEVAGLWGVPDVPSKPGKTAVELFDALASGEVKAVWIACTNPAQSMPGQDLVRAALQTAQFVVLQEAYRNTDTAAYADLLLPATSWGEKEGTVTNSERRITRVRAAVPAPGEARADWAIAADFAQRLGAALASAGAASPGRDATQLFPYTGTEAVFNEHRESTRGRDLDITGMSYAMLETAGPQQWPLREGEASGSKRLYEDGRFPTASGRARFVDAKHLAPAELVDGEYPLLLNTGRLRDQWHGMSRTGTVARLFSHAPQALLAMHPLDMASRGLAAGDIVAVRSRRGELMVGVESSQDVQPGQVFLPMHWGSQFMAGAGTNALTSPAFDPYSKQPELKLAAVTVAKRELGYEIVALARLDGGAAKKGGLALTETLQPLLQHFDWASLGLFGRDEDFLALHARCSAAPATAVLAAMDTALGLDNKDALLSYSDAARGISKKIRFAGERILAVRLAGETRAAAWLQDAMMDGVTSPELWRFALAPLSTPPLARATRGRIVCNCLDVSENEIAAKLAQGASMADVQATLKCGTSCGSCLPELKRLCVERGHRLGAAA